MKVNQTINKLSLAVLVTCVMITLGACKKKYTDPPPTGAPDIVANTTISDLKARLISTGTTVPVNDDIIIEGVVTCDDRSGNFYQQIAMQDSTGGILLRLAGNNLFNNYPVGRKIYVKCQGLVLGEYGRMIQLGGGIDVAGGGVTLLAPNLQPEHIIKGALNQPLVPKVVQVSALTTNLQDPYVNTLVKLVGYQFSGSDLGKNYADDGASGNRIIQPCTNASANQITLRTSNYSNFATLPVPQGNGDIIGVYSIFNTTKQFTIRDTTDVQFYGARCPTAAGGGTINLGTTSPFLINFDNIATSGLPAGVYVKQNASTGDLGFEGTVYNGSFSASTAWNQSSAGFKNYASATGLTSSANQTAQDASANRALGVRQTSATGFDPGAAFVFQLANTTGKTNLKLDFLLQSLDGLSAAARTTTWKVDYGVGDNPNSFTTIATSPTTLTTMVGSFSNTPVSVNFGSALNNQNQKVWIRIITLTATTGGGNRPSTAVDDVKFSWN